jgi:hypothetical protein
MQASQQAFLQRCASFLVEAVGSGARVAKDKWERRHIVGLVVAIGSVATGAMLALMLPAAAPQTEACAKRCQPLGWRLEKKYPNPFAPEGWRNTPRVECKCGSAT